MQLKINNLKSIISIKYNTMFILLCMAYPFYAQEIIPDQVPETQKIDSIQPFTERKIDGVSAVVGDFIVLDSDIDKAFLQLEAQGVNTREITRCQLFGKLLEDKLYAHHAIQDSIVVSDAEIRSYVDQQMDAFVQQAGSMEELLKFYKKDTEKALRDEMFEINKNNKLASEMQRKIVEDIEVTPEEVRQFYNKIPKEERPIFGTELKVAQIVMEPKISDEEKQIVIDRLRTIKSEIEELGVSFTSK